MMGLVEVYVEKTAGAQRGRPRNGHDVEDLQVSVDDVSDEAWAEDFRLDKGVLVDENLSTEDRIIMRSKLQKIQLPKNYLERGALLEKFNLCPIILVSASAGSGKSTAVGAWLNKKIVIQESFKASQGNSDEIDSSFSFPYVWYRLDSWDNDLDVFLRHLAYGVDVALHSPEGAGIQDLLVARSTMNDDTLFRAIVAKLEQVPGPAIWIFDDYHEVTNTAIHQFITLLLQHLGVEHQLCLITREDPPIMLAKARASGRVSDVREDDLRMTVEEAGGLLDPRLNSEQVSFIHRRTEGWVAGLQLTGQTIRSIEGSEGVDGFVEAYRDSKAYIMDYLVEEVLARQPESIGSFLVRTSFFEDFCPELVDYTLNLTPGESEQILKHLVRVNCFVMPLLDGSWFRYHQLFREVLRQRMKVSSTALSQRAGAWFEAKGQIQQAIHYYIDGSPLEAARLIEGLWSQMDLEFQSKAWLDLARRLPKDIVWQSPVISMGWGWSLLNSGVLDDAVLWLNRAQDLYDQKISGNPSWQGIQPTAIYIFDRKEFEQLPVNLLSAKAYISASQGDYKAVMTLNEGLQKIAKDIPYQRLWVIDTYVSTIQWSLGNLDAAIVAMKQACEVFGTTGQHFTVMVRESLVWVIAAIQIEKGDLAEAKVALEAAIHQVKHLAIGPILIARYKIYLAEIAAIRGDFKTAFSALKESEEQGLILDFLDWRQSYEHLLARLYAVQGRYELARRSILQGRESSYQIPIPETISFDDIQIMVDLASGEAIGLLTEGLDEALQESVLPDYTKEFRWKVIMRYWDTGKQGTASQLYRLCLGLLQRAKEQNRLIHTIDFELLAARLSPDVRKRQIHESEAYKLSGLTDRSNASINGNRYKQEQIVFSHYLWGNRVWSDADRAKQANANLSEPLTNRELELLDLMAKGYSNDQISQKLFITVSTVKTYNNTLFAKLGVKRRTEAIYKAHELGLI